MFKGCITSHFASSAEGSNYSLVEVPLVYEHCNDGTNGPMVRLPLWYTCTHTYTPTMVRTVEPRVLQPQDGADQRRGDIKVSKHGNTWNLPGKCVLCNQTLPFQPGSTNLGPPTNQGDPTNLGDSTNLGQLCNQTLPSYPQPGSPDQPGSPNQNG
jgi:hypothetical protein